MVFGYSEGKLGDALHVGAVVLCRGAVGQPSTNLCCLLRAMVRLEPKAVFLRLPLLQTVNSIRPEQPAIDTNTPHTTTILAVR
jgi:hypothetical protein